MAPRDFQTIRDQLEADLLVRQPDILTQEGSVAGDMIDVQALEFSRVYIITDFIDKASSVTGLEFLLDDQPTREKISEALELTAEDFDTLLSARIDNLALDYGLTRSVAVKSTGVERFFRATAGNVSVSLNTKVRTSGTGAIEFQTTTAIVTQPVSLDTGSGLWFIDIPIEGVVAGASGNVLANKINQLQPPIVGLTSANNTSATSGGADEESDRALLERIKLVERGRELNTVAGYKSFLLSQPGVLDAIVIHGENPLLIRGTGGIVDLYVIAEEQAIATKTIDYDNATMAGRIVLTKQPTISITSVTVNAITQVQGTDYQLSKDTGGFLGSERSQDALEFLVIPSDGQEVIVNYIYNKKISDIQSLLDDDPDNDVVNADELVKEGLKVLINLEADLTIFPSFDAATVEAEVSAALVAFVNVKGFGKSIFTSDLVAIIENTNGVDRVTIPFNLLARDGDVGASDIIIVENEYPRLNSVIFT